MTEERRAIQSNVDYAVKNQPRSLVRRQELLTDGETVHLPCDGGELILAYENGQQSVHWGFDSVDAMRLNFASLWSAASSSIDRDNIDHIVMNIEQLAQRDLVIPILQQESFELFAEWIELIHPELPDAPPEFSTGISLRRAQEEDLDIFESIWQDSLGELSDGLATFDYFAAEASWAGALELDGKVIGFAFNSLDGSSVGRVLTGAIARDHWGQGYGKELMHAALYQLGSEGVTKAIIRLRPDITQALKTCSGLGMRHHAGGIEWRRSTDETQIQEEIEARRKAGVKARYGNWR